MPASGLIGGLYSTVYEWCVGGCLYPCAEVRFNEEVCRWAAAGVKGDGKVGRYTREQG